jgi:PIN domain nuclease of toxin-antitoxin system
VGHPTTYVRKKIQIEIGRKNQFLLSLQNQKEELVLMLSKPAALHRDPCDRMLVCQALAHQLVLLTPDAMIRQYSGSVVW